VGGPRLIGVLKEPRSIRTAQRRIPGLDMAGGSAPDLAGKGLVSSFWQKHTLQG
jgi:hypothetical protein